MKKLLTSLILFIMVMNTLPSDSMVGDGVSLEYVPYGTKLGVGTKTTVPELLTLNGNAAFKQGSRPSNTSTYGKLYVNGTTSNLCFLDAVGAHTDLLLSTSGGGGASNIDGLSDARSSIYNVYLGNGAGAVDTGASYSTAVGINALATNISSSGLSNSAFGYQALRSNTTGDFNTATGFQTLNGNTTGYCNTASGYYSLFSNTTGYSNTAIGAMSLYPNTTGKWNTGIGAKSLYSNTTGDYNTAIGEQSLYSNSSGYSNTATGQSSLYSNTTGAGNTAIGYVSLTANTTGGANTATGQESLFSNTTGVFNTATGQGSLYSNTTGYSNTAIGAKSLYYPVTGQYNTAVGYNAGEGSGSNSFSNGTFLGASTGVALTTGSSNTLIGFQAGDAITTGSKNIIIGYDVDAPSATASNQLNIGNTLYANGMTAATKKIGVDKTNPANTLHVNGQIMMGNGTTACSSTIEGSQRYNSVGKRMEFCDGTDWRDFSSTGKPSFFYVHRNGSDQTGIAANTDTTVNWTTEAYDYNSEFNTTTDRFTPTRAGQYMITFKARLLSISDAKFGICRLLKNTSNYAYNVESVGAAVAANCIVSTVVYLNGTSDYVEAVVRHNDTASKSLDGLMNGSYMTGFRISD